MLLLPVVFITEYSAGTWKNIQVSHLLISSCVQYMSSIASYYVCFISIRISIIILKIITITILFPTSFNAMNNVV